MSEIEPSKSTDRETGRRYDLIHEARTIAAFKERLRQKVEGRIVQIQRCFDSAVSSRSPDQADYWLHELNVMKDFLKILDETH